MEEKAKIELREENGWIKVYVSGRLMVAFTLEEAYKVYSILKEKYGYKPK